MIFRFQNSPIKMNSCRTDFCTAKFGHLKVELEEAQVNIVMMIILSGLTFKRTKKGTSSKRPGTILADTHCMIHCTTVLVLHYYTLYYCI